MPTIVLVNNKGKLISIRLGCQWLSMTNTLAYSAERVVLTKVYNIGFNIRFSLLSPLKLQHNKLERLSISKIFMAANKVKTY